MSQSAKRVHELRHSLALDHLSRVRDVATSSPEFRRHIRILSTLLAAEVTRDLPLAEGQVRTPLEVTLRHELAVRVAIVPILRAGLGMVDPLTDLIPDAEVWHLGLYRDEATAQPVHYYDKLPPGNPPDVAIIVDPMLATGGSALMAVNALRGWGVPRISVVSVISTPEGIARLTEADPELQVFTVSVDRGLNERHYIVPGLGDAGDRIFNTSPSAE
ncbi:MAG: uracil phosphoribosyltransferase [Planctomyces sp.]